MIDGRKKEKSITKKDRRSGGLRHHSEVVHEVGVEEGDTDTCVYQRCVIN